MPIKPVHQLAAGTAFSASEAMKKIDDSSTHGEMEEE
jgi:hypothetical protein